jgi:hypothetical protein
VVASGTTVDRDATDVRTDARAAVAATGRICPQSSEVTPTELVPSRARRAWAKVLAARSAAARANPVFMVVS